MRAFNIHGFIIYMCFTFSSETKAIMYYTLQRIADSIQRNRDVFLLNMVS